MASKPADRRTLVGVALALSVVVLACAAHAAWTRSETARLARADGEVIDVEVRTSSRSEGSQRVPIARFTPAASGPVVAPLEPSSNSPFCCDVGQAVTILYDPASPRETARADLFADLYGPQAAFGGVAACFLLVVTRALRRGGGAAPS